MAFHSKLRHKQALSKKMYEYMMEVELRIYEKHIYDSHQNMSGCEMT